ncbi:hypothetical protein MMC16_003765 [Acarospora aff. strigata]|nr:hypothetical protein [Acarospora aff. strigata]
MNGPQSIVLAIGLIVLACGVVWCYATEHFERAWDLVGRTQRARAAAVPAAAVTAAAGAV